MARPTVSLWIRLITIGGFILNTGCPRKAQKGLTAYDTAKVPMTADEIIASLRNQNSLPRERTFRLKYQAQYEGERKQTFQLRIAGRDSLLWISAGFMGFEGLRMLWRQDSLFILNRLNREAYIGPVDSLKALFPAIGAADFLALLLGYFPPSLEGLAWNWLPQDKILQGMLPAYTVQACLRENFQITEWRIISLRDTFSLKYDLSFASPKVPYPKVDFRLPDENRLILTPKEVEYGEFDISPHFQLPDGYAVKSLSRFGF
ncbi:MAG: DUF4292 domain-containing protein [Bacteroidia bacterium]|nr:DUF4292 domain-containing protein [Bacteroidia bacterium]